MLRNVHQIESICHVFDGTCKGHVYRLFLWLPTFTVVRSRHTIWAPKLPKVDPQLLPGMGIETQPVLFDALSPNQPARGWRNTGKHLQNHSSSWTVLPESTELFPAAYCNTNHKKHTFQFQYISSNCNQQHAETGWGFSYCTPASAPLVTGLGHLQSRPLPRPPNQARYRQKNSRSVDWPKMGYSHLIGVMIINHWV